MFGMKIDFAIMAFHFIQLGIAFLLSLPIALNREMKKSGAGLRTFPLVSIASCGFMLLGLDVYEPAGAARIMYAVISGMGFIGGGAIFKDEAGARGTATAASLWNTAAIGITVAYQHYEIAIVLSIVNSSILQFSDPIKDKATRK